MSSYHPLTKKIFEIPDNFFIPTEAYAEVSFIIRHKGTKLAHFVKTDQQFIDCTVRFDVSSCKISLGLSVYDLADVPQIKNRVKPLTTEDLLSQEESHALISHALSALWPKVSHLELFQKAFGTIFPSSNEEKVTYPIWIRSMLTESIPGDEDEEDIDSMSDVEEFYITVPKGVTIVQVEKAILSAHKELAPHFLNEYPKEELTLTEFIDSSEEEETWVDSSESYQQLIVEYVCRLHHWTWRPLRYAIGIDLY